MRLPGRGGATKSRDTPAAAPLGDVPDRATKVYVRITIRTAGSRDDLILEVPSTVSEVQPPLTSRSGVRIMISASDVSFLPAPPDLTAEHALIWTTPTGQMEMPVHLSDIDEPQWILTSAGPARRVQRRQFARTAIHLAADVVAVGPDRGQAHWSGLIIDLSEGGVRVLVPGVPPPPGARIVVTFPITEAGELLDCPGVVIRHVGTTGGGEEERTALAVRFEDPEEHGDTIRKMVFAEQLRLRQTRLDHEI